MTDTQKNPNPFSLEQAMDGVYDSVKTKVAKDFLENKEGIKMMLKMRAELLFMTVEAYENAGFSRAEALALVLHDNGTGTGKKDSHDSE